MIGQTMLDIRTVGARMVGARHRGGHHPAGTLKERFDPRHNHLSTIRLVLATTVAVVHSLEVGFGYQPHLGHSGLGELAVDAFFVLSGFLLAGSYLRLNSIRRYSWHRFLRIMPAFWICLLIIALLVAPLIARMQGLSAASVFSGEQSSIRFLVSNSMLMMRQFGISGLPVDVPNPGVLNGSLWTLFYEAVCYAAVVGLGVIGALKRRPWLTLAVVGLLWAILALHSAGIEIVGQERLLRFALVFLIGSTLWLYADRVPVRADLAAAAAAVVLVALLTLPDYRALAAPAFGYLCLWLVVARPPTTQARSDFSYGLYVYHWPILQLLVVAGLTGLGEAVFVLIGVSLSLVAAYFSWTLVERPCLEFKNASWVTRDRAGSRPGTSLPVSSRSGTGAAPRPRTPSSPPVPARPPRGTAR